MIIGRLKQFGNHRGFIWALLFGPVLLLSWQYLTGTLYYGEFLHLTGELSAQLLIVTLAVTPFRLAWPARQWTTWLMRNRRYFGLASFVYAVPHLLVYLQKTGNLAGIAKDAVEPGMWTGWFAIILFLPLAATSNNASARWLGKSWKTLHKLVYFAAVLTFVHWVLVAFDPLPALIHAGLLSVIESYRLLKTMSNSRARAG
jgi:sulfoxide reductase heme-binding subunit YedZ